MQLDKFDYTDEQRSVVAEALDEVIFLEGPAGTGKSSAAVARMLALMEAGVPGGKFLIWAPQRLLGYAYQSAFIQASVKAGGTPTILTIGGLASRMIRLFWQLIAERAGFRKPDQPPVFLTMETAQYYMATLVQPLLDEGLFAALTIQRNRLYSQILDNLNKAALVGFPHSEIGERLSSAWVGEVKQTRIYSDAQVCANQFRSYCYQNNLLDFSLQVEVFREFCWKLEPCRNYLLNQYKHLIYDNVEEDAAAVHELFRDWLPHFDSAMLIYDWQAGYRNFLGADPKSGYGLRDACSKYFRFEKSLVNEPQIQALIAEIGVQLGKQVGSLIPDGIIPEKAAPNNVQVDDAIVLKPHRYYPQMLDWVAENIADLVVEQQIAPGEIVVLAPFLSDSLRFALMERLDALQIPARSHRPSRALSEEAAVRCLITLSKLAFPEWELMTSKYDLTYALMEAIADIDLVRAQILSAHTAKIILGQVILGSYADLNSVLRDRVTYKFGERFEELRSWLSENSTPNIPFDHFLSRLFGEILSQPGFGFFGGIDQGALTANLIESVQKFRRVAGEHLELDGIPLGKEYIRMVEQGVIAAQYLTNYDPEAEKSAVLLAPAYTFLTRNQPRQIQFWLDIGSRGWSQRLYQPLTQPYVLSRNWEKGRLWSDQDEVDAGYELLYRTVLGLLRRGGKRIYLGISELGEQGYEQKGPLMRTINRILRAIRRSEQES
jgi:hypothetical protein